MTVHAVPFSPRRALALLMLAVAGFVVVSAFDRIAFEHAYLPGAERRDWHRLLRVMGYWPAWLAAAGAMLLIDSGRPARAFEPPLRDRWSRAAVLAISTGLAGLAAELLKLVFRRERPDMHAGEYVFRSILEATFRTSGLALPSSHAAVAAAASAALCYLHPRAWPVWVVLGAGCAGTRVLDRAHFLSDVYLGAIVGYAAFLFVRRLHEAHGAGAAHH